MQITKFRALLAALAEQLAKPPEQQDPAEVAKTVKGLQTLVEAEKDNGDGDEKGYAVVEAQLKQLRADLDAQAASTREFQRMGLAVRGAQVIVPGRSARLEMLADGRAFLDDETARRFGALALVCITAHRPETLSPQIREVAAAVTKAADADIFDPATAAAALFSHEFRAEMIRNIEAAGQVFNLCRRVPLVTMGQTIYPRFILGMRAYPTAVAAKIRRTAPVLDSVVLTPVKWATLAGLPNEFFRDARLLADVGQFIGVESTQGIVEALDIAVIDGDGSADSGGIIGLRQSNTIASVAAAGGHTTYATLTGDDFSEVVGGITKTYALPNARWLLSLSMQRVARKLKGTDGHPLYERGQAGEPSTIDDYPYVLSQFMPAKTAVTAGVKYAAFGDLRRSHYFGMIRNIELAASEDADFESDVTLIRGLVHVDCKEVDPTAVVVGKTAAQ